MLMAHKIALNPNNTQRTYFARAAGTARCAYNWALAEWQRQYEAWKTDNSLPKPSEQALRRQLKAIKREQFPWMMEVTKCAPQLAIIPKGVRLPVSENAKKARAKLSRLHARAANIRADALHKLTSDLTRRFHTIGIEDLNVRGMMKNHRLARSIADMSFFEFRRQLEYKAERRGGIVVVADRWFPSSKTCSVCGTVQEKMPLDVRQWTCPDCGTIHDRDVNAARNLLAYGLTVLNGSTVSSTGCKACGEEGSGRLRKTAVKPASLKQETSTKTTYA